jgi:guanine deaminase
VKAELTIFRASILHFSKAMDGANVSPDYFDDGALVVSGDRIVAVGHFQALNAQYKCSLEHDFSGKLIIPGLIDSHLHFPQTEMIAKYGEQLLSWLETYTFPTERKFDDPTYCKFIAKHFITQLINNGTTTAFAFPSVHTESVDALFSQASKHNMSMISGKVCMDRNCPEFLQDTPETAQQLSHELIEKWHEKGRNLYALTPRFAPTSTDKQLSLLGELAQQHPSVFLQTHLSENHGEIAWVKSLFPHHNTYLDVYDRYNMVHSRSLFGHCLHLHEQEWERLADTGASAIFCPSSNLFLGSGLFSLEQAQKYKVNVSLATDVGAGTSFNMLKTYGDAYKISQLQQCPLSAIQGLYMMSQGPACAYNLDHEIGNLNPGTYADFVVLNPYSNAMSDLRFESLSRYRSEGAANTTEGIALSEDMLFALAFIGDDRAIEATYVAGVDLKQQLKEQRYALA